MENLKVYEVTNTESEGYYQLALLEGELQCKDLIIRMGSLEIKTRASQLESKVISPASIQILHDGKPLRVRRLKLIFDIHEVPYIKLEYFP